LFFSTVHSRKFKFELKTYLVGSDTTSTASEDDIPDYSNYFGHHHAYHQAHYCPSARGHCGLENYQRELNQRNGQTLEEQFDKYQMRTTATTTTSGVQPYSTTSGVQPYYPIIHDPVKTLAAERNVKPTKLPHYYPVIEEQTIGNSSYRLDSANGRSAYSADHASGKSAYQADHASGKSAYQASHCNRRSTYQADHASGRSTYQADQGFQRLSKPVSPDPNVYRISEADQELRRSAERQDNFHYYTSWGRYDRSMYLPFFCETIHDGVAMFDGDYVAFD